EKRDTAARDAQAAAEARAVETLAAELDRVRADAERTLADQLAAAEERHRVDIARLETEAREKSAAAAQGEQAAAELNRLRADAERMLAAELAAAEKRHRADIARLEAEAAAENEAAVRDARATAEAQAAQTLAAELDRMRTDAGQTLAAQLAAAEKRHRTNIVRLEAESTEKSNVASRDVRAAAETQAVQTLAAELDMVRADAERTLAAELAAAEARSRAEVWRVKADSRKTLVEKLEQVQTDAHREQLEAAHRSTDRQEAVAHEARAVGDLNPPLASIPPEASLEPVHSGDLDSNNVTDYYALWQARFAGTEVPTVEASTDPLPRVNRTRRRRALSVAAMLLILVINSVGSDSAPREALAAGTPGMNQSIELTGALDQDGALTSPIPGDQRLLDPGETDTEDDPETSVSGRVPPSRLALQGTCLLVVMLLLRLALFVGEGLVWHGLVVTLGLVLAGFAVMQAPWGG
ncbi:MAG: hypothetical protein QF681_16210, partial [Vicinamibacterales bacterium]|nr:hypothetical protein [Vicinamibacterales bacterium]